VTPVGGRSSICDMGMPPQLHRRLAAILIMDVVGYSRLTEADVESTHQRLRAIMNDVVAPTLAETAGRVVKRTGDGAMIEFSSVTLAARAALQIQRESRSQESGLPAEQQIWLRMGINLGDIIVDPSDGDIYGDGVNIAARLEGLANPGEIILSESAVQTVDRTGYRFVDLGIRQLKNITRPIRTYRLVAEDDPESERDPSSDVAFVSFQRERLQDRPAIAVMPFKNSDHSVDHVHVADTLTENLIASIGRWRSFPVASRHSVFSYKDRNVDLKSAAMQLGVRFVVDGSLRTSGSRIRAQVQFMDVETMDHLLDEHFDQDEADEFQMIDDLVLSISGALEPQVLRYERERAPALSPHQATPYECLARGLWHHFRFTPADNEKAQAYFRRILELDPTHAQASAALAVALNYPATAGWVTDRRSAYNDAIVHARNAVLFDPRDPHAHFSLGLICQNTGSPHEAITQFLEAIRLNPSHVPSLANLGLTYSFIGRADLGLPYSERAVKIGAYDSRLFVWQACLAVTYYLSRRYRDALAACQGSLSAKPDYPVAIRYLAASLGQLGRSVEASNVVRLLARLDGDLSKTETYLGQMFVAAAVRHIVEGLRKAGFS
jgi:adenylate cyclase